ncbi:MAG: glycosyltransferase family 4 protein [Pyrinomonadaceae bacterium]|nr:glycosyltransferase family 4 protein [Pyrinomonadaceae bacterium]
MKILFVCGGGIVSGKEIITLSLMEGLRVRGHDVRCITSTWGTGEFAERLKATGTPFTKAPLGFISKTLNRSALLMTLHQMLKTPKLWRSYKAYLREFKPDIVVQSNFHHAFLLWPLMDARNTIFHVHDPVAQTDFYRRLFKLLNRRLSAFVGVSDFIRDMIVQLGVPQAKVFSVRNGIDIKVIEESNDNHSGEANGSVKIGIVGQVGEWKGHDDFIEALAGLRRDAFSFHGVIYGNGDAGYIKSLKEKIDDYKLTEHVRWAGFVGDAEQIFSATDICIVPSRSQDPCPTVAIEAAHFGVPLIATRQGGLPELVLDGETGYLVDARSPEQITEKLKLLIQDAALRQRMSQAARAHGLQHLTRERMVLEMETIFARSCRIKDDA